MVALTNASGIHVRSISQWCLGTLLTVYHKLEAQIMHSKVRSYLQSSSSSPSELNLKSRR